MLTVLRSIVNRKKVSKMATIPSTLSEFYKDVSKFMEITGFKNTPVDTVQGAFKCMTLRYLGLTKVTDNERESAAMVLQVAIEGATARGWVLK